MCALSGQHGNHLGRINDCFRYQLSQQPGSSEQQPGPAVRRQGQIFTLYILMSPRFARLWKSDDACKQAEEADETWKQ
jgi:hypothetical protein